MSGILTLALAICALGSLSGPVAAQAFQDGGLKATLQALGLAEEDEKPEIDYRERAPLVVPPGGAEAMLPPPVDGKAAADPNWPKDPDVARQKQRAAEANAPIVRDDPGRPLMPSELNKGRRKIMSTYTADDPAPSGNQRTTLMPSELGFKGWGGDALWGAKEKPLTFNGEPERESLVQPPPGYQTPAPNAPYGVVEKKKDDIFKLPSLFDRPQTSAPQ